MKKYVIASLLFIVSCSFICAEELPLKIAESTDKTIMIIPDGWKKARWNDWGSHKILERYFGLITGQRVPIKNAKFAAKPNFREQYKYVIWLYRQPEVDKVIGDQLDKIDDDGFIIKSKGNDIYISGKFWWGTNFAAYDFLERFAGCRFYGPEPRFWMPKQDGLIGPLDIAPKADFISVPDNISLIEEPVYKARWIRGFPLYAYRVRSRDNFHHAMTKLLSVKKYYKDHPEYYPMLKGKRSAPRGHYWQPCISNPEVIKTIADNIIAIFDKNPTQSSASVGMNDGNEFCECKPCMAIAPKSITDKRTRLAYATCDFYNKLAVRVSRKHPEKRLGCLAYAMLRKLPAGAIKLHKNIVPYLTLDSAQLFEEREQGDFNRSAKKWEAISSKMGIYEYIYGGGYIIPRTYNRHLLKSIKSRYGVNADAFYAEAYPNWGLDGPKYWAVAKLLWNPNRDIEKMLADYYSDLFGPAAEHMKGYFVSLEETWCTQTLESDRSNYRWLRDIKQLGIFTKEKCEEAENFLKKAEDAADTEDIKKRIAYFSKSFAVTSAICKRYDANKELEKVLSNKDADDVAIIKGLDMWLKSGDLTTAAAKARKLMQAFNVLGDSSMDVMIQWFDEHPAKALNIITDYIVDSVATKAKTDSKEDFDTLIDEFIAARWGENKELESTLAYIGKMAKNTAYLYVYNLKAKPLIDGEITEEEWGEKSFDGSFYPLYWLNGRFSGNMMDPDKRNIKMWLKSDKDFLYIACIVEQDKKLLSAKTTDNDTVSWRKFTYFRGGEDSITFNPRTRQFQNISVNALGTYSDASNDKLDWNVVKEIKSKQTDTGWQYEMKVSTAGLAINRKAADKRRAIMPVLNYRGVKDPKKSNAKKTTRAKSLLINTLRPAQYVKGHIGTSNSPLTGVMITGPRVVYQKAVESIE
ncbi:MAG: DUF4838 domain-containing protein [Planctomycetota bacterium]|jgi:hypothetical protein